jgi:polysaccharide biosynthesis transport protein
VSAARDGEPTGLWAMSLGEYLQIARRHLLVLLVVPVLVGVAMYVFTDSRSRTYSATATVMLRPNDPNERLGSSTGSGSDSINAVSAERLVRAQASIAAGPQVRAAAQVRLDVLTSEQIRDAVRVRAAIDSNMLMITATSRVPAQAADVANVIAEEYIENRRLVAVEGLERAIADIDENLATIGEELAGLEAQPSDQSRDAALETARDQYRTLSDRRLQLRIDAELKRGEAELIAAAVEPARPVSPTPLKSSIIAAIAALLAVAGVVLLKDRLDVRLRGREEAEAFTSLTTLAEVPTDRELQRSSRGVAAIASPDGLVAEAIRSLRVSLRFLGLDTPIQSVLVTSAVAEDGKSTIAANLAASYAQSGARTLLVSADLRRPRVETLLNSTSATGLVELLTELASRQEQARGRKKVTERPARGAAPSGLPVPPVIAARAISIAAWCQHDIDDLWVLPTGEPIANPVEILGSAVTKDFFALAGEQFDMVIVDSPPVMAVADGLVLAQFVDGVVVVASVHKTPRTLLARAVELLSSGSARILGLVINRAPNERSNYYGYHGYARKDRE